jgi:hypothetical protein
MSHARLPNLELHSADGAPVELAEFLDRTLLAVAVRYYG